MHNLDLADLAWRKSSRSVGQGACVELAVRVDRTLVRDSKNPSGPILAFPQGSVAMFLRELKQVCPERE
ncbi:DUF397 domain-containing protein [Kutzneria sp. CA-103260]|uniref:DUF397 domain-containing protein n=1 Tax=Kutzneria sp. CA-103260 TaxID=2802641 RepID=UPI001BEDF41E|nr:DUF397 domain-containing protein [Kutzneria sp. CA-103260]QUQ68735.1 hypothetical protein JJ691_64820 [Kutzneria sp. CA-103260]